MARGRPQLFTSRHVVTVIVSRDDYNALRARADEIAIERPGFGIADLMRDHIPRILGRAAPGQKPVDAKTARVRQLRQISRTALELAKSISA
jgi:hypothetical protein